MVSVFAEKGIRFAMGTMLLQSQPVIEPGSTVPTSPLPPPNATADNTAAVAAAAAVGAVIVADAAEGG